MEREEIQAHQALTLSQLQRQVSAALATPQLQYVWVVAELSDVRQRGGHCYMELLEKDPERGTPMARMRAVIWASTFGRIATEFYAATGQRLAAGIKVMVCGSVNNHPVYGMSLVISAINPEYTMGDLMRRRREIVERLRREGILEMNRQLEFPQVCQRIAVISSDQAAGYGDFCNQLYTNPWRLRFCTQLFPAVMQGERSARSIIESLDAIASHEGEWDCVVIIRGGGATSDLACFEDYDLAANIAQFPLPVIIGIGHERDITVLDYVARMRVKTPTAAAEWLIAHGAALLADLNERGHRIVRMATERISGAKEQLSYYQGALPVAPVNAVERARSRLRNALMAVGQIGARRIAPALTRLDTLQSNIPLLLDNTLQRHIERLNVKANMIEALSPQATLNRGYSITRVNGHAVTDASQVHPGDVITTIVARGTLTSTVNQQEQ
ncbi:MAG: exodeoxyribonuclease VII large subunit [Muribaculaceae bacterium]|nr:exodeoxyribonuclease VII large subunit [Muribaculaceae bacterium]